MSDSLIHAGIHVTGVKFLAAGASSEAWRIEAGDALYILRLHRPDSGHPPMCEYEFGMRRRLRGLTPLVPEPVATGADLPARDNAEGPTDWILDRFVVGEFADRGRLPERVCRELGSVLAALHSLDCAGYGRPLNDRSAITGMASSLDAGVRTRFQDPWPFTGEPLSSHPVAAVAPESLPLIEAAGERVLSWISVSKMVINHTDLHDRQLILRDGRLVALIDFGDSMIGSPAWDIASFRYFHGAEQARALLAGYTADRSEAGLLMLQSQDLAVVIALHHISRSFILGRPQRREFAQSRLIDSLDERHH